MYNSKKIRKIENDPTKHYPNKNEASLLRKIMSETGLSEKEVREIKKYRKMLAEAAKSSEKSITNAQTKFYRDCIKRACQQTGLVPQHPKTMEALQHILDNYNNSFWHKPWYIYGYGAFNNTATSIVKNYAK